jgi:hypothetical protein
MVELHLHCPHTSSWNTHRDRFTLEHYEATEFGKARGCVGAMLQAGMLWVRAPDEVNGLFFNLPNPSGRTTPWGLLSL